MLPKTFTPLLALLFLTSIGFAKVAPIAGEQPLSVSVTEVTELAKGWSVKKAVLDKDVYNEKKENIGEVKDLIIAPDTKVSYAIVSVGGFLGIGSHHVAIPVDRFVFDEEGGVRLNGASKEELKKIPNFRYL